MARTRLSRRRETKSKKNLYLTLIAIIAIVYLLIKFGIPLLVNFSLFVSQIGRNEETNTIVQKTYIAPPILNPLPEATNSAKITISGKAFKNQSISLYINDELIAKESTDDKGEFLFSETLDNGQNEIKVNATYDNNKSDFSATSTIIFDNKSPELTIESPSDGQTFHKGDNVIEVTGKTDVNTDVTVNGFWAIVNDNNQYIYDLTLKEGENEILVEAVDNAGNKSEKLIKVNYSS